MQSILIVIYHAFQVKMSAMNKPENSRKRKQFSIKDKIDIIDQVKNGKSRSAVTKEFSVPEATLNTQFVALPLYTFPASNNLTNKNK